METWGSNVKWCQFALDWPKMESMPVDFRKDLSLEDREKVIEYCVNDVLSTREVIRRNQSAIDLRMEVAKAYKGMKTMSLSNTGLGRETMIRDYCERTGLERNDVRDRMTERKKVTLAEVIDGRIAFQTPVFQDFLKSLVSSPDNLVTKKFKRSITFQNRTYDLLKGGLHSVNKMELHRSNERFQLIDFDWGSYYPMLMVRLGICPEHLDKDVFLPLLLDYTLDRLAAKKEGRKNDAESLKIKINSIFGLLGAEYGPLADKKALYQVTINGQLLLLMWIERASFTGAKCVYANTDGATFMVPRESVDDFYRAAEEFMQVIDIPQEFALYQTAYLADVNNYVIIKEDGDVKIKGRYVWAKIPPEKNPSNRISKKAAVEYLVNKTPIRETIKAETNPYLFMIGKRARSGGKKGKPDFVYYDGQQHTLPGTFRYMITKSGGIIKKEYADKTGAMLEAHPSRSKSCQWKQTITLQEPFPSDVDHLYYEREAHKLIQGFREDERFVPNQMSLF